MKNNPRICVVGSINMDMVTEVSKMPALGETVLGGTFTTHPGGKGANQAIAAARLSANVSLIGAVGKDAFGETLNEYLKSENVDQSGVKIIPYTSTGVATIIVSENDNRIIVSSGANSKVTPEIISESKDIIINSDIVLLQLETPIETVSYTVDLAYKHNIPVIVNPAPYQKMTEEILTKTTYFTPNEGEASSMLSVPLDESIKKKLITTKGRQGVQYITSEDIAKKVPAYRVAVKDTTGAGDAFNGALAVEIASGVEIGQAINFANAAAALSISKQGAQDGMPTKKEVKEFLNKIEN